jgi:hypothetical protein
VRRHSSRAARVLEQFGLKQHGRHRQVVRQQRKPLRRRPGGGEGDWHKTHGRAFLDAEIYDSKAITLQAGDVMTVQPTGTVHEAEAEFDATCPLGRANVVELQVDGREGTAFCDRTLLRKHQTKVTYVVHSSTRRSTSTR